MQKKQKGELGHLQYKKTVMLLATIAMFAVVIAVFVGGLIYFHKKENIMTVMAILLVLPAAKITVGYLVLLPHHACPVDLKNQTQTHCGALLSAYDLIVSNEKKPIGTQVIVVSDHVVCALTDESKADAKLFETSLTNFLKNDHINATVTLYFDEKTFLKRVAQLAANFENTEDLQLRMEHTLNSVKSMAL